MTTGLFGRLTPGWALRGWTTVPHALVHIGHGGLVLLNEVGFQAATACDGSTDLTMPIFFPEHREAFQQLVKAGVVETCPPGSGLADYQTYRLAPNPFLRSVHWSVTGKCNLECRHCYLHAPDRRFQDLNLADMRRIIGQIKLSNAFEVSITGGEPFLRQDLWEILAALQENHIRVTQLNTNGLLVTEPVLQRLRAMKLDVPLYLSFDGVGSHDDIRGIAGTEAATVAAMRRIRKAGFPLGIETAVYRKNADRMIATYELLKELGIGFWKMSPVMDSGRWKATGGGENLNYGEISETYATLVEHFRADGRPFGLQLGGFYSYRKSTGEESVPFDKSGSPLGERGFSCLSCRQHLYLLPDGTVMPCIPMTDTSIRGEMPNLLRDPLADIFSETSEYWKIVSLHLEDLTARNPSCRACARLPQCGLGCRAASILGGNGVYGQDPSACDFWKNRYESFPYECADRATKA